VQVDPITSTLNAPGITFLKLEHDEPLSTFAFDFNLRRFDESNIDYDALCSPACVAGAYTRPLFCST